MTWFDNMDLTAMRADVANMLPGTAVIQAVTRTSDGAGGWSESWAAVAGGTVACRLDPLGRSLSKTEVQLLRESMTIAFQLTVPHDAPVATDCRVVIGGTTYEVLSLDVYHSERVSRRAIVAVME